MTSILSCLNSPNTRIMKKKTKQWSVSWEKAHKSCKNCIFPRNTKIERCPIWGKLKRTSKTLRYLLAHFSPWQLTKGLWHFLQSFHDFLTIFHKLSPTICCFFEKLDVNYFVFTVILLKKFLKSSESWVFDNGNHIIKLHGLKYRRMG